MRAVRVGAVGGGHWWAGAAPGSGPPSAPNSAPLRPPFGPALGPFVNRSWYLSSEVGVKGGRDSYQLQYIGVPSARETGRETIRIHP